MQAPWPTRLEALVQINLDDMLVSFGWEHSKVGRALAGVVFRPAARRFALEVLALDDEVARCGLRAGAQAVVPRFAQRLSVTGQEHIPLLGPLLVLSNHPGMADTLALFASLPREDLKVVASDRPFLRALGAISERMIYVPERSDARLGVLRETTQYLRSGGAVLTFPAGHIEPDPAVLPGAVESIESWSDSIGVIVRKAPEVTVIGAVVKRVLARQATYHPLTRLRRAQKDRERLGASLQLIAHTLFPRLWPLETEVAFTRPLDGSTLAALGDPRAITRAVRDHYRPYLQAAVLN